MTKEHKPIRWIGSTCRDLRKFPEAVRRICGFALDQAQRGGKHADAKALRGFREAGVLEIVCNYDGSTFRTVYTVGFPEVIYALHAFQKKSKCGLATPKPEIELIKQRLKMAGNDYKMLYPIDQRARGHEK